jgi:hypothetical protein
VRRNLVDFVQKHNSALRQLDIELTRLQELVQHALDVFTNVATCTHGVRKRRVEKKRRATRKEKRKKN